MMDILLPCIKCHESCLTCKGPSDSDCIYCKDEYKMAKEICIKDKCGIGKFEDSSGNCHVCHIKCK